MDGKRYYIDLKGQEFEVSRELYEAYVKGYRKERYFTNILVKLNEALHMLTSRERKIIYALFYEGPAKCSLQKKWVLPGQHSGHRKRGF